MTELLQERSLQILSYVCVLAIGCVIGWFSREPRTVVQMPERAPNGKFLPWKESR